MCVRVGGGGVREREGGVCVLIRGIIIIPFLYGCADFFGDFYVQ